MLGLKMTAIPTGKTAPGRRRIAILVAMLFAAFNAPATQLSDEGQLRALAVQIKAAASRVQAAQRIDDVSIMQLRRSLAALRSLDAAERNPQFRAKLAATERLQAKLDWLLSTHPGTTDRQQNGVQRVAKEAVSDGHGSSCANAMGLSVAVPVKLAIGQGDQRTAAAWFRLERGSRMMRIVADSDAADPALAVYDNCSPGAATIASNDDDIGLDAVAVAPAGAGPVFIHLTNSGLAGEVLLSAQAANGSIAGTVLESGSNLPIGGIDVLLFTTYGWYESHVTTDDAGHYSLPIVAPGNYYVRASDGIHLPAVYPSATCPYPLEWYGISSCDLASAQPIVVGDGSNVAGIDFSLDLGRSVAGQLRSTDGAPIQGEVVLYATGGVQLNFAGSDQFGRYAFSPLPGAQYKARAEAQGYGGQMYDRVDCTGPLKDQCDLGVATTIDTTAADAIHVDFSLPLLASIDGTVFGPGGVPYGGSYSIAMLDNDGGQISSYGFYGSPYHLGPVAPGTYLLSVVANGYFSQIYAGVDCDVSCATGIGSATPVVVQPGQATTADFHLDRLPDVSGFVKDAVSATPLGGSRVYASPTPPSNFSPIRSATADADGKYTLSGIPPGSYYLWAQSDDHIDQIYPAIDCERQGYASTALCNVVGASLLNVAPGATPGAYDFLLRQAASIGGHALTRTEIPTDLPAYLAVYAFDPTASIVASANTDAAGNYLIRDLPAGAYYLYAESTYSGIYVPQLWQGIDCFVYCAPTTGTAVAVGESATATGINFNMLQLDAVVGRVTDSNGLPLPGVLIDLFDSLTGAYLQTGQTNWNGNYFVRGSLGSAFYVATYAGAGYIDQVHSGIECSQGPAYLGLCPFTGATAVVLSVNATEPHVVDFALTVNDRLFSNGFEIP